MEYIEDPFRKPTLIKDLVQHRKLSGFKCCLYVDKNKE